MTPKERFNAATQAHRDALQALLDKYKSVGPAAQIAALTNQLAQEKTRLDQLQSDYDNLLSSTSDYLEQSAQQIAAIDVATDPTQAAPIQ
ncbi:hypothetical protein [Methylocystis sp. JR02]|uniref:hypothetical protein n=1 Tax=Methylocystis sp. JR02 TaxID=3046284 RepID=UPI0024B912B9|nr:hypothetical protein [Methylocystis sp. JR02]MDJ0449240.1 hypothetical protein [Methylocystis sp. JR02]